MARTDDHDPRRNGHDAQQAGADLASRLEVLWNTGSRPNIREFIGRHAALAPAQLVEVIRVDQQHRWRIGEPTPASSYLAQFPELRSDPDVAVDLIWSEYLVRKSLGNTPDLEEYARAFPQYEADLRRQYEVYRWIERPDDSIPSSFRIPGRSPEDPDPSGPQDSTPAAEPAQAKIESPPGATALRMPGFEILNLVGRGGMGVVYRARQLSLNREIALKVLHPAFTTDPHLLGRCHKEAEIAAGLTDSRILPVFDVLEHAGAPVLVMPFIKGWNLGQILIHRRRAKKGDLPADRHPCSTLDTREYLRFILPLLDRVIAAVAVIHEGGVLHRDIKPANVLVDERDNIWLSDFGLARLVDEPQSVASGSRLGTPGFMSPEQWAGSRGLDYRSDVFSLGVVLYNALSLEMPYGPGYLSEGAPPPPPPSAVDPALPPGFDAVILKALHPDPANRYGSARELIADWERARADPDRRVLPVHAPAKPRGWRALKDRRTALLSSAISLALIYSIYNHFFGANVSETPGPGEEPRQPVVPGPARSDRAEERVAVTLRTEPPADRAVFVPIDPREGRPRIDQAVWSASTDRSPLRAELVPGSYIVEVAAGPRFQEVLRYLPGRDEVDDLKRGFTVPARSLSWMRGRDGSVAWPDVRIPPEGVASEMTLFQGDRQFRMGSDKPLQSAASPHVVEVLPFYLDPTEVTVDAVREVAESYDPLLRCGLDLPDDYAASCVTFHEAVQYAEILGKRLPDEAEYEFAATMGGTRDYPWGNSPEPISPSQWPFGPAGTPEFDRTDTSPPVFGLYSNVAEWTASWYMLYPGDSHRRVLPLEAHLGSRVVRGGTPPVVKRETPKEDTAEQGPRHRMGYTPAQSLPGLGFRCARSASPRFLNRTSPADPEG